MYEGHVLSPRRWFRGLGLVAGFGMREQSSRQSVCVRECVGMERFLRRFK